MKGTLYGIGVGPGDPELLTLKATRMIRRCAVVAAPNSGGKEQLALQIAKEYIGGKEILLCDLPMTWDKALLQRSQQRAAEQLCERLERGEDVAFLTLGDPSVYATYSYLHRLVKEAGHTVEIVPGITSFCAAAAVLGEPLCEGNQPLHIMPASSESLAQTLDGEGVKVIMKMGKQRDKVLELLTQKGLDKQSRMVERCTLPGEAVYRDLERIPSEGGYFSLLIVREDME